MANQHSMAEVESISTVSAGGHGPAALSEGRISAGGLPNRSIFLCDQNCSGKTTSAASNTISGHHRTLIDVYKTKLADQLRACGLHDQVPTAGWTKKFVVAVFMYNEQRLPPSPSRPVIHSSPLLNGSNAHSQTQRHSSLAAANRLKKSNAQEGKHGSAGLLKQRP